MKPACWAIFAVSAAAAAPVAEQPVGIVLATTGSKLVRAGLQTALAARAGDVLFAGDVLRAEAGTVAFSFCPTKSLDTLAAGGEALFEASQVKLRSGKLADHKPANACFLPQVVRVAAATQQHYGVSMSRAAGPEPAAMAEEKLPPEVRTALSAIPKDGGNLALVSRAAVFEKHHLWANALAEYRSLAPEWRDAAWVKGKLFELQEQLAAAAAQPAGLQGKTYALLAGVSKYQKLPPDKWLQYADQDAAVFARHLESPRGGGLAKDQILLFTNEQATTAALRNAFETLLRRAGKQDTVLVLIAGHGTVETPGSNKAFILTYDSDFQDLASTALPMADVQALVQQQLARVGRIILLVDVCRSGVIGTIRSTNVNKAVEGLAEADGGEVFGMMASRPKELSYEGPQFGGGHGAFSYFVVKALAGAADKNDNGVVDVNELIGYVRDKVAEATQDKQHPRDFGNIDNSVALADVRKPGIQITRVPVLFDSRDGQPVLLASTAQTPLPAGADTSAFEQALASGRILPGQGAFEALRDLRGRVSPEKYLALENRLRVALENRGQQVLLTYLQGEEVPQARGQFEAAAVCTEAARRLTPESLLLEAREDFFRGRAALFEKHYAAGADLLERAARIDPAGAYSYNALGIAYLEQGDFGRAIPAFLDAARLAPHWTYPLHNLALAEVENGDYGAAIRSYERAMRLAPRAAYLPYNLALLYQRLNRRKDAEAQYRRAISLAPRMAAAYNGLGSLRAAEGRRAEAERLYREALKQDPSMLPARHNLALLLAGERSRASEAIVLFRENLSRQSEFLPSRLSLAETLAAQGDRAGAVAEYHEVLRLRPDYTAARAAMAALLDPAAALEELRRAAVHDPALYERIGDLEAARGNTAAALEAYRAALPAAGPEARKRVRRKLATARP